MPEKKSIKIWTRKRHDPCWSVTSVPLCIRSGDDLDLGDLFRRPDPDSNAPVFNLAAGSNALAAKQSKLSFLQHTDFRGVGEATEEPDWSSLSQMTYLDHPIHRPPRAQSWSHLRLEGQLERFSESMFQFVTPWPQLWEEFSDDAEEEAVLVPSPDTYYDMCRSTRQPGQSLVSQGPGQGKGQKKRRKIKYFVTTSSKEESRKQLLRH